MSVHRSGRIYCCDGKKYFSIWRIAPNNERDPMKKSFSNGPFTISKVKVKRQREGQPYEEMKRCIVDCRGVPVDFGSRKKLDRKLERLNEGYARYLMTQGTKAEGL